MTCHFVNILHRTKTWRKIAVQKRVQAALGITMQRQGDLLKVLERNVLEQFFQHDNHVVQILHLVFAKNNVRCHEEQLILKAVHEEQNTIRRTVRPRVLEEHEPIENARDHPIFCVNLQGGV